MAVDIDIIAKLRPSSYLTSTTFDDSWTETMMDNAIIFASDGVGDPTWAAVIMTALLIVGQIAKWVRDDILRARDVADKAIEREERGKRLKKEAEDRENVKRVLVTNTQEVKSSIEELKVQTNGMQDKLVTKHADMAAEKEHAVVLLDAMLDKAKKAATGEKIDLNATIINLAEELIKQHKEDKLRKVSDSTITK